MSNRTKSIALCLAFGLVVVAAATLEITVDHERRIAEAGLQADGDARLIAAWIASEVVGARPAPPGTAEATDAAATGTAPAGTPPAGTPPAGTVPAGTPPTGAAVTGPAGTIEKAFDAALIPQPAEAPAQTRTLTNLLERVPLRDGDMVSIIDAKQQQVTRRPAAPGAPEPRILDATLPPAADAQAAPVTVRQVSAIDGMTRTHAVRQVEALPLMVVTGRADAGWKADWHRRSATTLAGALLLVALSVIATRERLRRVALDDRFARLATTDPLTGLANHRCFLERAWIEFGRAKRKSSTIAVAILDLDALRRINEEFGRATGDRALSAVAGACRGALRDSDVLGHVGGDEFAIVMSDITPDGARLVAERLCAAVAAATVRSDRDVAVPISASIGMAIIDSGDGSLDEALAKAEELLYDAKTGRRTRIRVQSVTG